MAKHSEISLIYLAGLAQGLALVTFPAASSIFTSPKDYGLSSTQYGAMFLPQVILAILASSLAPALARRWTLKFVFLLGLGSNLTSMVLLALSSLFMSSSLLAYGLLLLATTALGLGFGATVMALNTFAEAFFPDRVDSAVLALNALLGVGTALAPLFVAVFVALGAWWLLPVLVGAALLVLLIFSASAPLRIAADSGTRREKNALRTLPLRFWLYAAAILLYGIVETLNGNWSMLYLVQQRGVPEVWASFALTAFWTMVTVGRVVVAVISSKVSSRWIYPILPVLLTVAFLVIAQVSTDVGGVVAFAFAGLACSAFLPLSISLGGKEFPLLTSLVSGELIAFYQAGYGIAAFGIGPLQDRMGVPLSTIYASASLIAIVMVVLALFVVRPLSVVKKAYM
ncbi:MAG TPA: MFS transporter [Ktedonobacteraceae bacterium]